MIKRGVNIYIDETEAQKAVENLQLKFEKLKNEMQALENQGKKGSKEWKNLSNNLNKVENDLKEVSQEIQFTEMTMRQLESVKARLNAQLKSAIPGSEEWKQYANGIQVCEKRLQELKAGAKNTDGAIRQLDNSVTKNKTSLQKLADGFNRFQALALGAAAAIAGITITIKNCIQSYAELTDAIADVRKTTGLTIEETRELDKSLKSYDTRTSRLQLLQLARDAGKLGITGKQAIEDFVKSADKIQVALGEDLGEDAIKNIGKIADVFGLVKKMGFAESLNAIGSSINALGQASTADEGYIVDFTQRLSGIGAQAKISAQDIMGYASAIDQTGIKVEMSATAMQAFITKMFTDPAKFAKAAGLEVKEFTKLVGTDANAAILQMLQAMHDRGGFQALVPMFADLGTEGQRSIGVLAAIAEKLDNVKEAQALSNKSFSEGTSLINEYNIKNETAGAKLDKAKKKFAEVSVELGEKLYPLMTKTISATSFMIRGINILIGNFDTLKPLIIAGGLALAAFNKEFLYNIVLGQKGIVTKTVELAQKVKDIILTKTMTLQLDLQVAAFARGTVAGRLFAQTMVVIRAAFTSWTGILLIISAVISAVTLLSMKKKEASEAEREIAREKLEAEREYNQEISDNYGQQLALYKKLQQQYMSFGDDSVKKDKWIKSNQESFDKLGLSIHSIIDAENAYKNNEESVLKSMMNRAIMAANETEMNKIAAKIAKARRELDLAQDKAKLVKDSYEKNKFGDLADPSKNPYSGAVGNKIDGEIIKVRNAQRELDKLNKQWDSMFNENIKIAAEIEKDGFKNIYADDAANNNKQFDSESEKEKKAREKAAKEKLKEEKKDYEKELKAAEEVGKAKQLLTEKDYTKGLISQETYNKKTIKNDIEALKAKMAVEIKNKKSTLDTELAIEQKERDLQELKYKDQLDILQAGETEYKNELEKQLADHEITQEQYNQLMLAKEIAIIQKKLELQKEFGINSIKTEKELAEAKVKLEKEIQNQQKKEKKTTTKKGSTKYKQEWEIIRDDLAKAEEQYKNGEISYQEYNDRLEDIAKRRINNITEQTKQGLQDASTAVSSLKDADLTKAETTYNKELNALKQKLDKGIISQEEYNEKSTALEEKKEQEQKEIKKKYAGIELAINISKIISETALAVMKSIATLGIPLGIPFGVLAGAAGAAQIAAAVAEYNNIQGLESGLYPTVTRSQDGKQFKVNSVNKMQTGVFSKPSVLVGESGPELVVDNKRFKKIMRDRPEVINYIVNGYEKGKYPSLSKKAIDNASNNSDAVMYAVVGMLDKLNKTINGSDIYTLRKRLKKANDVIDKITNKFN